MSEAQGAAAGAEAPGADQQGEAPAEQGIDQSTEDRWGLRSQLAAQPESIRQILNVDEIEKVIGSKYDEAMSRYQPLDAFVDRLGPLAESDEQGASQLEGLLGFYDLTERAAQMGEDGVPMDAEAHQQLQEWWDEVGEQLGFFGDPEQGGEEEAPEEEADPMAEMRSQLEALQAEIDGNKQQGQAAQIQTHAVSLLERAGIESDLDSQDTQPIDHVLNIAQGYRAKGEDPMAAIEHGVKDYLSLSGQGEQSSLSAAGQPTATVEEALAGQQRNGSSPGAALNGGQADMNPESVSGFKDAKRLAMQRMRA